MYVILLALRWILLIRTRTVLRIAQVLVELERDAHRLLHFVNPRRLEVVLGWHRLAVRARREVTVHLPPSPNADRPRLSRMTAVLVRHYSLEERLLDPDEVGIPFRRGVGARIFEAEGRLVDSGRRRRVARCLLIICILSDYVTQDGMVQGADKRVGSADGGGMTMVQGKENRQPRPSYAAGGSH